MLGRNAQLDALDALLARAEHSTPSPKPIPAVPTIITDRRSVRTGWKRNGIIIGRTWPSGFDEREYQLLLVGGNARRVASPDDYARDGQPIYHLTTRERTAGRRLLDRLCADAFETLVVPTQPLFIKRRVREHNAACNDGRALLLNFIINASIAGYAGVTYFAVGTGAGTPSNGDHQLFSEFFRKQPSSYAVSGNQALIATFFNTTDGVSGSQTVYSEAGIFGSAPNGYSGGQASGSPIASATANTGILFAHAPYTYTKTNTTALTNDYYVFEN